MNKENIAKWCKICTISIKKKYMSVCAFVCTDISFLPKCDLEVFPIPPSFEAKRCLSVLDFYKKNSDSLITFKEVTSPEQMSLYDGKELVVRAKDAILLEKNLPDDDLSGWTFFDATSNIKGYIENVQEMPTQILITCGVSNKKYQFPLIDDFIESKDFENKIINLKLPMNYFE
jgi:ribosomal 30S subunit maturation factor RimM